ncbi:uncharacterized protein N7482_008748 [Penicillium canariense]|uniref:Uncharacterized protein n=1 Tax=Penicillium canariense TaxID=189055 RepID=A0A9W9LIU2_9EURO|nr:uncharacterized protein N7482_008748 [Penicillium canariense]KAJ5157648.1 hypothetical protein N7482_008748 [Penicillium canariense]
MGVNKGDVISVLLTPEWAIQTVEWSQRFLIYKTDYYRVSFTNAKSETTQSTDPEDSGLLFIAKDRVDAFKALDMGKTDQDVCTVTVSTEFLYGQSKDGKKRFLVFHDKRLRIFQHRFMQGGIMDAMKSAQEMATKLKEGFGDELQPFK